MKYLFLILVLLFGCEDSFEYRLGPQGDNGEIGDAGDDGANGKDGLDGVDGEDGLDGPRGQIGWSGMPGEDGDDGSQGPAGPRGPGDKDIYSGTLDGDGKAIVDLDLDLNNLPYIQLWLWVEDGNFETGEGWYESIFRSVIKDDGYLHIISRYSINQQYRIILIR